MDRQYKAIFFDLDGTLMPMDEKEFLGRYFVLLHGFATRHGYEGKKFIESVEHGVGAMIMGPGDESNDVKFWTTFEKAYGEGVTRADVEALLDEYYSVDFGTLGDGMYVNPAAKEVIDVLAAKGYPLYLTTMPVFPKIAVDWRLKWAGIDINSFKHVTHYENSNSAKPQLRYYQANLDVAGLKGEDVLMVGNNTLEDLAIMELGADAFLVTDCLIDRAGNFDVNTVKHGTMEEFLEFAKSLPECEPCA